MYLTEVLGSFAYLQKFSSLNSSKEVLQEISGNESIAEDLLTTWKVKTEITPAGWRMAMIQKKEEKGPCSVYRESSRTSLKNLSEGVLELYRRTGLYPKEMGYIGIEELPVIDGIAARISELYKITDQQIAEAPIHTRAICWLTNNRLFPEYRLRQSLEACAHP